VRHVMEEMLCAWVRDGMLGVRTRGIIHLVKQGLGHKQAAQTWSIKKYAQI